MSEKREPSPNNLKLKVPLVLFPWERESWLLVFGDTTDTAAARRAMIRPPVTMQQQGQGSGRQKYKKCILRYSGWSHIVKASDICHQQMTIYKNIPGSPMMIRPPVTMPAPRASVCCTTSAFQSKFLISLQHKLGLKIFITSCFILLNNLCSLQEVMKLCSEVQFASRFKWQYKRFFFVFKWMTKIYKVKTEAL